MKTLVTGGAGYIGSHAVYELIRDGHQVVVLDDLSTGNKEAIHKDATFYEGDQRDSVLLDKIFKENEIDVVMHFSAKLIVPESVEKPIEYFENNVHGVAVLLEAMKRNGVKNIVFSSTAAVYGEPERTPIMESDNKSPVNPYGASKLACEWLIESSSKAYGINYVIFRYFNVAGADATGEIGQSTKGRELTHLIPVVIETATGIREKMSVFGNDYDTKDGSCVRDYIHVTDLAKAHVLGAKHTLKNQSGTFNLGSKDGYSVLEIIDQVEKTIDKKVNFNIEGRRLGDPAVLIASNDSAISELGFKIENSLEDIIKSDYNWRTNKKY